ncbi:hypothetical protein Klosneuvirus_1_341 [Klosneuvirus KNV1]|uniref:Uncharacterized protein n=1 Tax=Klosneuvirus KNV1 TaxID=1977640 RepID=A0A1V0SIL7_9VIRU|nr:hypothetical protein Klosneuvirus_1_341 [Klosneuvirus KNV1]
MDLYDEQKKENIKVPTWLVMSLLSIFLAIAIVVLYLQFIRYALVGKSIDKGDTTSTALLLSPEITFGLAQLI